MKHLAGKTRPISRYAVTSDQRKRKLVVIGVILVILFVVWLLIIKARPETPTETVSTPVATEVATQPESEPDSESSTPVVNHNPTYPVSRVVDGDTLDVDIDGSTYRIRLIGVDTPETVHPSKPQECYGAEASNFMKNLLTGQQVALEGDSSQGDTDRYGRLLRYVYYDNKNINLKLISDGYGHEYTYNTPYKYQSEFRSAQDEASQQRRGLWGAC